MDSKTDDNKSDVMNSTAETVEAAISRDLKTAMLAKDELRVSVLRSLKSAFTYVKVAPGAGDAELTDEQVLGILSKEAKKRQESAESFRKGGSEERAQKETQEQAIIEAYLPPKLDAETVATYVAEAVASTEATSLQQMGQVIAAVKQKTGSSADGALIAQLVKEKLAQESPSK